MDTFIDKTKKNIVKDIINCFKEGPKCEIQNNLIIDFS
jgi:hypothetical protein